MTIVFSVANQKGGIGKTTTALALGRFLTLKGKTLLIDMDGQANLSLMAGVDSGKTSYDLLTGVPIRDCITAVDGMDIIPADRRLYAISLYSNTCLRDALQPVLKEYRYAVIDTAPALNTLSLNALAASNAVIIPAAADVFSLSSLIDMLDTVKRIKQGLNRNLQVAGVLITRFVARRKNDYLQDIERACSTSGIRLFKTRIRESAAVVNAQSAGMDILSFAPSSPVARDYMNFFSELMKG